MKISRVDKSHLVSINTNRILDKGVLKNNINIIKSQRLDMIFTAFRFTNLIKKYLQFRGLNKQADIFTKSMVYTRWFNRITQHLVKIN